MKREKISLIVFVTKDFYKLLTCLVVTWILKLKIDIQVRRVCKPLKSLGIHTVSIHPGATIDHQIQG